MIYPLYSRPSESGDWPRLRSERKRSARTAAWEVILHASAELRFCLWASGLGAIIQEMGYLAANSSTFRLLREEGRRLRLPRTALGSVGGALKQRSRGLQPEKDWEDWIPTKSNGPWHRRRPRCSGRAPSRAAKQTRGSCGWFASVFLPRVHFSFATFRRTKTGKPAKRCEYIAPPVLSIKHTGGGRQAPAHVNRCQRVV